MNGLVLGLVLLAAEKPLAGAVIVVDAGHGGQRYSKSYTGGTRGVTTRTTEGELNLKVAVELERLLVEQGATVHMTRTADHRLSREGSSNGHELHARIDFFDHHNCHFFVSVHHNAGPPTATGHTALYKHNAADDTLYEAAARSVNDALVGAVPGPKRSLIKGSYHILRETDIPGTIAESGFLTNPAFDALAATPEFPKAEASALCAGAVRYWTAHKPALVKLRDGRPAARRDPTTYTATALNPKYQAELAALLKQVAPDGKPDPAKAGEYVRRFKAVVGETGSLAAAWDGATIKLTGEVGQKARHDRLIDVLVGMKLYVIENGVTWPK